MKLMLAMSKPRTWKMGGVTWTKAACRAVYRACGLVSLR